MDHCFQEGERGGEEQGTEMENEALGGMGVSYIYSSHHGRKTNTSTRLQLICPFSPSLPYWCEQHWLQRSAGVTLAGAQPADGVGWGLGGVPSLAILLTFTLQFQLFKAACTSAACQPAPAVKSGSWNLKAHAASSPPRLAVFLAVTPMHQHMLVCVCQYVCVRACVCSVSCRLFLEFVSVNQKSFLILVDVCASLSRPSL